ncbi:30S ribosomal protein S6 [Mycoplasma sp. 128]|uniref:30S ribosomal protein S6 n=1 Tax=Mycoplasma sp. 3341 TaxID=3447506 RepID=UPI003F655EC6
MAKYEIMVLLDSTANESVLSSLLSSVFKNKAEVTKLEETQLAYPIKKQNTAQYFVVKVDAQGEEIKEFGRRANLEKQVLRNLVINLDTERALQRKPKVNRAKKFQKPKKQADRRPVENRQPRDKKDANESSAE